MKRNTAERMLTERKIPARHDVPKKLSFLEGITFMKGVIHQNLLSYKVSERQIR